jgi:hypothetical protein
MKKSISVLLLILLTVCLAACQATDVPPPTSGSGEIIDISDPTLTVYYHEVFHVTLESSIRTKELSDAWTQTLIEKLLYAPETGETEEKISDEVFTHEEFDKYNGRLNINEGVSWFLTNGALFRYQNQKLYRVETYLGEGREVECSDELKTMLKGAIYYAPTNFYSGTWRNGNLELKHVFDTEHKIEVTVDSILYEPPQSSPKTDRKYVIQLSLLAQEDLTAGVSCTTEYSEDNWGDMEHTTAQLKAGEKQTVTVELFMNRSFNFTLNVKISAAGQTDSNIEISVSAPSGK